MMLKKLVSVILAVASLLFCAGCWDHLEINKMFIIAGIGLDFNDSGKTYHATVECVNIETEGDKNISAKIVEGDGDTAYGAITNAMLLTGGVMFGNHCKVVVIGDRLARDGVDEIIEMILRSPDFRKTVDLLVAKDGDAQSVLKRKTVSNDIVSYELSKILRSNADYVKNTVEAGIYRFHEAIVSSCPYYVVPTVYSRDNNGEDVLLADGCAVFSGGKMLGFLDGRQSKMFNLLTGNASEAIIPVEVPEVAKGTVDVKISRSRPRVSPAIRGDSLSVYVGIDIQATLEDASLLGTDPSDSPTAWLIQNVINRRISGEAENLVADVQRMYGADIFGFYREFEDRYRREWPALAQDWGSYFRDMNVTVAPDIHITGSGLIGDYRPKSGEGYNANALP